jgi:glycosyltransferase involved in cell wall biosynthesis
MPTIGLCMIVRDEAHVVERCLDSVRPLIDGAVIVDTGSRDGTPEIVRAYLVRHGIPGAGSAEVQSILRPGRGWTVRRGRADLPSNLPSICNSAGKSRQ